MSPERQDNDRLACFVCSLNLSGLTITKVILWLVAITIVSFAIGFGILAISGDFPPGAGQKASPFKNTVLGSPNTTSFLPDGASSGEIRILLGAGDLTLRGGAPGGRLMEATVYSKRPEMQPDYTESMNNSVKTVAMTETGHRKKDWVVANAPESWANTWDVRLGDEIPVAVTVNVGAGDCELLLGDSNLTSLTVNTGAGDTTIDLAGYHGGWFDAFIYHGVGDLTLRIPPGSNTRILLHQGVGDITANGMVQNNEQYTTAGFNPALPVNEITLSQGVGSIQLEAV
ncbi:MAG: toast rack family protein [Methanoregula sp.]|nr:toast rack family protein [Methanoregula sp.]